MRAKGFIETKQYSQTSKTIINEPFFQDLRDISNYTPMIDITKDGEKISFTRLGLKNGNFVNVIASCQDIDNKLSDLQGK